MRFSRSLKSSAQSLPSPDGAFIATIFPSILSIRETRSLEKTRVITLPPELAASISWFLWSSSLNRVLIASTDNIRVYSSTDPQFSANITNPTSGTTKVVFVTFGSTDDEVCVFAEFGLKLSIIDLRTSKSVDIYSPKFYTPGTAGKGFAYRPGTKSLALLTRHGGKDVVSLHGREGYEVTRSWCPGTIDAQGISWTPDGRWLVVWESPAQGHRAVVYTADGHLFKIWNGRMAVEDEVDLALGAGIKLFDWAKTGASVALGDYSRTVCVLAAPSFKESMSFHHTTAVQPSDTLQIWQEQVTPAQSGRFVREFVAAAQTTYLPTLDSPTNNNTEVKSGTNILSFDCSGTLLATRTENMPTVIWIWDIATRVLRSVMIFHAPIAKATWHPATGEILLIRCEGEESRSLAHLWDPSWPGPKIVDFAQQMVGGKVIGKTTARWLNIESSTPALYFSDSQDCILASLAGLPDHPDHPEGGEQDVTLPWVDAEAREFDIYGQQEESPLCLVPANERASRMQVEELDEGSTRMSGGSEEVDDTFRFKRFVEPRTREMGKPWT